eukprot:766189-Hanusia_phi.AAC.1
MAMRVVGLSLLLLSSLGGGGGEEMKCGGKEDEFPIKVHITSPMQGWVLLNGRLPVSLFFSRRNSSGLGACRSRDHSGSIRILIDDRMFEEVSIGDDASFSRVFPVQLAQGRHFLRIESAAAARTSFQQETVSFSIIDSDDMFHDVQHYVELMNHPPPNDTLRACRTEKPLQGLAILYHKNARIKYKDRWVEKCIESILNQNYPFFDIVELNYGGDSHAYMQQYLYRLEGKRYTFFSRDFGSHAIAMNFLLDWAFREEYDIVFNVNLDDYYSPDRFKLQDYRKNRGERCGELRQGSIR